MVDLDLDPADMTRDELLDELWGNTDREAHNLWVYGDVPERATDAQLRRAVASKRETDAFREELGMLDIEMRSLLSLPR